MKYKNIKEARFISRPNRFIAKVDIDGEEVTVHVKNTGRCRELLVPGCRVFLERAENPERKTPYDLIAVEKVREDGKALLKEWGVEGDYIGIGHCILGYADGPYPEVRERTSQVVMVK